MRFWVFFFFLRLNLDIDVRELSKVSKDVKHLIRSDHEFLENSTKMLRDFEGKQRQLCSFKEEKKSLGCFDKN